MLKCAHLMTSNWFMTSLIQLMNYARKLGIGLLCPNMEIRPRAPKMEFFKNFSFLWKDLQILLLTSPQLTPDIKFKSSYARKCDFGLLCPNMEIKPQAPKNGIFKKNFIFWKDLQISLPTSPQPPKTLNLRQVMQENMILAYYAQIWKFGPKLPKMQFFKKFAFFWKGLQISLLTSPQPPADIKFKSSYARKHIINPEWRSYQWWAFNWPKNHSSLITKSEIITY